jgi:hypothetical protein
MWKQGPPTSRQRWRYGNVCIAMVAASVDEAVGAILNASLRLALSPRSGGEYRVRALVSTRSCLLHSARCMYRPR